ncbi:MAG TPA: cytochrome c oxidase assembly protein [Candidatus Acidoferrales bacterium]|nr:cytochrome c oxidase assembly protein [Candidatus Acidoferrales bacterium]
MIACAMLLSVTLYALGLRRLAQANRRFPVRATLSFALGLAAIAAALSPPFDALADASLTWHMVQHLVLINVAAPLLLLGAPVRLALAATPARYATSLAKFLSSGFVGTLTHPIFAWLQFATVLYVTHFSPLYELALENETVHSFEHLLFLVSALIFWTPLLAVAPAPHAPSHPVRILFILLALPMSAFLGFAFYVTGHVLYAHYASHANALADQMNAGTVMWLAGGTPLFLALLWNVADWGERERRLASIADG